MCASPVKLILIADDYDDAAALMAELVQHATPYEAIAAKDGREAIDLAQQRRPDVAILDIDMPQIGGIEVARILRSEFGENRPLLIALTGGTHTDDAQLSGMFDHVFRKPIGTMTLLRVLADA
jgi:two-component system CheB/CheR fusion protein